MLREKPEEERKLPARISFLALFILVFANIFLALFAILKAILMGQSPMTDRFAVSSLNEIRF